jgi:heptaprenyl diphosphate synthase
MRGVEKAMLDRIATGDPHADEVCTQLVRAGGKRLRPKLVLLAARLGTRNDERVIRIAAAAELLHLATLYHDDVVDQSLLRRHQLSVNARWGNHAAVSAGTYLFARAMEEFGAAGDDVNGLVSRTLVDLWKGQMSEIEKAYRLDSTPSDHLRTIEGKTAALYELPCRLGALLSAATPEVDSALGSYGRDLGIAFQLTDDLLDLLADEASLGKPVRSDLRDGIYTLSVLYALESGGESAKQLRALLTTTDLTTQQSVEALAILRREGAVTRARDTAAAFVAQAKRHARSLPAMAATDVLVALADEVGRRVPA